VDKLDRALINTLQDGLPVVAQPFAVTAEELGTTEEDVIERIQRLLEEGCLTRFGPMFDADKMGGAVSLCAMQVPEEDFEAVADKVNAFAGVAHNYARSHALNMWFVVATEHPDQLQEVVGRIEEVTGLPVYHMPKLEEFYVGLRLAV